MNENIPQPEADRPAGSPEPVAPHSRPAAPEGTVPERIEGEDAHAIADDEADQAGADAAVARLRAADPAAGAEPDVSALRATVDERRLAGAQVGASPSAGRDDLAAARARRWSRWAPLAGAAAAALVVGTGGGYAIGAAGDAPEPAAGVITLGTPGGAGAGPEMATDGAATSGAGGETAAMSRDAAGMWPGWSGRTVFTSEGLSTDGGTAQAWAFDPAAAFTEATAAQAASALGVTGTPTLDFGAWTVGPNDGTAPSVTVYADGTTSVSYYDPTKDPWSCVPTLEREGEVAPLEGESEGDVAEGDAATGGGVDGSTGIAVDEPCTQRDLGPAPSGDAALGQVRDVLSALGQDPAAFELVVEEFSEASQTYVTAHHVVEGQRTGVVWSVGFTGGGLQSLYGSLAPLVSLGEYDVVSPTEAVERLGDPRFGFGGGPIAYLEGAGPSDAAVSSEPSEPTLPAPVEPGSAIRWPVEQVTIVEARLGGAMHMQTDGAATLLPTYELTSADGGIWSVLAVAESDLDLSSGR